MISVVLAAAIALAAPQVARGIFLSKMRAARTATIVAPGPLKAGSCVGPASTDETSYFIGNDYIELGVSPLGDFGAPCTKPAGFQSSKSQIGLSSAFNGFGDGQPSIDYFLPGSPEERFGLGYKTSDDTLIGGDNARLMGTHGITIESMTPGAGTVSFTGRLGSALQIDCTYTLMPGDKHFLTDVTITNIASDTLFDVRYHRSFDPDNTVYAGGYFHTVNTIKATQAAGDNLTIVSATSTAGDAFHLAYGKRAAIFFATADERAVGYVGGFSNAYTYSYLHDNAFNTPLTKNYSLTGDVAVQITFGLGNMVGGASTNLKYTTNLVFVDSEEDIIAIAEDSTPVPIPVVSASGDPHMVNILGEHFNLLRSGEVELLKVPRGATASEMNFSMFALVEDLGEPVQRCLEAPYITSLTFRGKWFGDRPVFVDMRNGKLVAFVGDQELQRQRNPLVAGRISASKNVSIHMPNEGHVAIRIGGATIDVVRDVRPVHFFLNVQARSLSELGDSIGGILGQDDHSDFAKNADCNNNAASYHRMSATDRRGSSASASLDF